MGYRSTMSDDILLKNDRYLLDFDDIRLNLPLGRNKKWRNTIDIPLLKLISMGYRSTMSDDILLKNDRYPLDFDDIRLKAPIGGKNVK
jgi:hypothetical protein